jgi:hypothetical protein
LLTFSLLKSFPLLSSKQLVTAHRNPFPPHLDVTEPDIGAWLTAGDVVECLEDSYWYSATITNVTARGEYLVDWQLGGTGTCEIGNIQPFRAFYIGQILEVYDEEVQERFNCTVIGVNDDSDLYETLCANDMIYRNVHLGLVRRHDESKLTVNNVTDEVAH